MKKNKMPKCLMREKFYSLCFFEDQINNNTLSHTQPNLQTIIKMLSDGDAKCETAVQASSYVRPLTVNGQPANGVSVHKTTFDYGVQTINNPMSTPQSDISGLDEVMMKKRQKRKEYKKRKKQQKKLVEKQNREQFKQIIDLFYQRQAKFEDYEDRLEELVCSFNQSDFKNIFDSILKQRVAIIQNSIWEYTQAILEEDPREMRHDHPFYLEMVDQMYKYYKLIERSSFQAEKVIYIYLSLNSKQTDQPITPQDLGRRTFRYLVQMDDTLKKLLNMCDKKITFVRVVERQKLEVMISKLKNFRQRSDNNMFNAQHEDDLDDMDSTRARQGSYQQGYDGQGEDDEDEEEEEIEYEDEKSTAMSENSEEFYQDGGVREHSHQVSLQQQMHQHGGGQRSVMMMRRKKKKRVLQGFEQEEQKCYNFLQNLVIDKDSRLQCNVDQDFCSRVLVRVTRSMDRSFKKPTEFDLLLKQLDNIQPMKKVSKQYSGLY